MEGDGGRDGGMEGRMGGWRDGREDGEWNKWENGGMEEKGGKVMGRGMEQGRDGRRDRRKEGGGMGEERVGWAGSLYSTVGETLREGRTSLFACGFFTEPSPGVRVQQETDNKPNRNVLEVVLRTRNGGHWVE